MNKAGTKLKLVFRLTVWPIAPFRPGWPGAPATPFFPGAPGFPASPYKGKKKL